MTTHETVRKMTDGQRGDIVATMTGAIPPDLTFTEAQSIIGAKGPFIVEIRAVFAKRRTNAIPVDDEWFHLEVDNTIDPMDVVTSAGHEAKGWKYLGPKFPGKQTYRVKLVRLGYVRNLDEAKRKAKAIDCRLLEGQAREPFKAKFQKPDGKGPIVFGASEWQSPSGHAHVTSLFDFEGEWDSGFYWSGIDFYGYYRWLVVGKQLSIV